MKNKIKRLAWLIPLTASIVIGYFVFLGQNFLRICEDTSALLFGSATMLILFLIIFLLTVVKSSKSNFKLMFGIEVLLLFCYGLFFNLAIRPFNHYFTVTARQDSIQNVLLPSIDCGKKIFTAYESYCQNRLNLYDAKLTSAISNERLAPSDLDSLGFNDTIPLERQADNKRFILENQLKSDLYESLKKSSVEWLENAADNLKKWKAIGVVQSYCVLQDEIEKYKSELVSYSLFSQKNEGATVFTYDCVDSNANELFCRKDKITIQSYVLLSVLFSLGLLIYFFEPRDFRNTNLFLKIISRRKSREDDDTDVRL